MLTQQDYNIKIAEYILAECKSENHKNMTFEELLDVFDLRDNNYSDSEVLYHNIVDGFKKQQLNLFNNMVNNSQTNIVTCGNCGEVLLHQVGDTEIFCGYCDRNMALSDCPDLKY